ncbi:hypothetical protein MMC07_000406 [Pseudocyphellaria aurata]|nr:hypothetical protein [Pseudocyphellaria aurata]
MTDLRIDELEYQDVVSRALVAIESGRALAESTRRWREYHTSSSHEGGTLISKDAATSAGPVASCCHRCARVVTGSDDSNPAEAYCQPDPGTNHPAPQLPAGQNAAGLGQICSHSQPKEQLAASAQLLNRVQSGPSEVDMRGLPGRNAEEAAQPLTVPPWSCDGLLPAHACQSAVSFCCSTPSVSSTSDAQHSRCTRPAPTTQITTGAQQGTDSTLQLARVRALTVTLTDLRSHQVSRNNITVVHSAGIALSSPGPELSLLAL